ncbi:unnamed protein product [Withania somnifera]
MLAGIMACSIGTLHTTYLGLPLEAKFKNNDIWNCAVGKFENKYATWQSEYLSMGGRLTLISSVLDSIPTYFMFLFPIPTEVLKQVDKIRRDFLWEGNNSSYKLYPIIWDIVTQSKCNGGLGIRYLPNHNKCLLMKWIWRLCTRVVNAPYGVGPWKFSKLDTEFSQQVHFKPGNGAHSSLWKDKWLNNTAFMDVHPSIFNISRDKNSTTAPKRSNNNWNMH